MSDLQIYGKIQLFSHITLILKEAFSVFCPQFIVGAEQKGSFKIVYEIPSGEVKNS